LATQVFADEELERLRRFPEIGRDELFRFFTLSPADVAFVDPGRGRGPADRLGLAVALCVLPWLGFVPDKVSAAPPVAVARLADQLGVDRDELRGYGRRAKTRTDGFVPARWHGYLETAAKSANTSACRHYWELCTRPPTALGRDPGPMPVEGARVHLVDPAPLRHVVDLRPGYQRRVHQPHHRLLSRHDWRS
jgi:hypothetical protein